MKILITGATGFIARNFVKTVSHQFQNKIDFFFYTRRPNIAKNFYSKFENTTIISEINNDLPAPDVVLNLAGAPIIKSPLIMQSLELLRKSRIYYTSSLCEQLKKFHKFPNLFISGSATSIYKHNHFPVNEASELLGGNFLGNLAFDWENSAWEGCKTTASRVVLLRLANVLGNDGGMYKKMTPFFKKGLGATIGSGSQFVPWISINDTIRAILFIIAHHDIQGAVNIVNTTVSTQKELSTALAKSFSQKVYLKIPKVLVKMSQGDIARALTESLLVSPDKLLHHGFQFEDLDLASLFEQLKKTKKL